MEWKEPPEMDTGAPLPEIYENGKTLLCSYICSNPDFPGWGKGAPTDHKGFQEYCAVIEFNEVSRFKYGAPTDEALGYHPLYKLGVGFYGFYILDKSPELKLETGCKLWVATFHDETLQVACKSARVLSHRIDVSAPAEALKTILKTARHLDN